jgi:ubiquinone/menaquinone biosynthesis C-methylase UbiE
MVGNESGTGGGADEVTAGLRAGYEAAAPAWADGPGPLYARLAHVLVAAAPVPLPGAAVLDLGAGPGVAGRAALAAGARQVVAADLSLGMLRRARDLRARDLRARDLRARDLRARDLRARDLRARDLRARDLRGPELRGPDLCDPDLAGGAAWRPVAADAAALPFSNHSFDLVVAAFCLNHLGSLAAGLAEVRRVGAAIAASTFAPGWDHPAKGAVDKVLRSFGYQPPAWYACLSPGSRAGDPAVLAEHAAAAGFTDVQVRTLDVRTALAAPAELASWRLGLAQTAPFMRSLDPPDQAAVRRAAEHAVAGLAGASPLVVSMVMLTAH